MTLNYDKIIDAMAEAAFKASEKASFDDRVRAEPLVFYRLIVEAALEALQGELPGVAHDDYDRGVTAYEFYNKLKNLREEE